MEALTLLQNSQKIQNYDNIPAPMKDLPHWIIWKLEQSDKDKPTKVPYTSTGYNASVTKPTNWSTFNNAIKAFPNGYDGIGFVFTSDAGLCGIDLDNCIIDNKIQQWALDILREFDSYSEISQSGKGIHIICAGNVITGRKVKVNDHAIEIYSTSRYFCMTGNRINEYSIEIQPRQNEIDSLITAENPPKAQYIPTKKSITVDEILKKIHESKAVAKFEQLMAGDCSAYDNDASRADFALAFMLVFWTKDKAQIREILMQSQLWDDKWERQDYFDRTVDKAILSNPNTYNWEYAANHSNNSHKSFNLTDMGNGERLANRHGEILKFSQPENLWYIWNDKQWLADQRNYIKVLAKDTVRSIYREAADIEDEKDRKAFIDHARRSEGNNRVEAMISMAKSEKNIPVIPGEFDNDNLLFNCQNGIIDLCTGKLLQHDKKYLMSKICPVSFDPNAKSELWENFLMETTQEDTQLIKYLQRAVGYSLTGDTREEILFFIHGPTATGKSTFIEAIQKIVGEYSRTTDFETFLQTKFNASVRNDIARLAGARFVFSVEVDNGEYLAEATIKQIVGGDTITARHLYQEYFEFQPKLKLWLVANHKPEITASDSAMWRRIHCIPFVRTIPKARRDPSIKLRLKDIELSGPAILAWAVQGCLEWQEFGLNPPPIVLEATEQYHSDMDYITKFTDENCYIAPNMQASIGALYRTYTNWCIKNGDRYESKKMFDQQLKETYPNIKKIKKRTGWFWNEIGIVPLDTEKTPSEYDDSNIPAESSEDFF